MEGYAVAKLYFKYGAMGSSKTAQALITKYNYEENDMKVWLIKPSADVRDGVSILRSRIGLQAEVQVITPEQDVYQVFTQTRQGSCDVIIVDECQFMTAEQIDQLRAIVMIILCRCCALACARIFKPSCSPAPAG